jgi:hypothetical protein
MLYSFSVRLADILDHRHPLYMLADRMEWSRFDEAFEPMYCGDNRVPAIRFGIPLRQSYLRKGKHAFIGYHRYAAARRIVHIQVASEDVLPLLKTLDPALLMLETSCKSVSEGETLLEAAKHLIGG